jgi:hypothetical protein
MIGTYPQKDNFTFDFFEGTRENSTFRMSAKLPGFGCDVVITDEDPRRDYCGALFLLEKPSALSPGGKVL